MKKTCSNCVASNLPVNRESGQGSVEFIVVFTLFALLITGLFEMTRVFRTKHTLNHATFKAARIGAVNHALIEPMESELANNMSELFIRGERSLEGLAAATARARAFGEVVSGFGGGIKIISPTRRVFNQLSINQRIRRTDTEEFDVVAVIPNDNLRWRPRRVASLAGGGSINLQDANLLKVRSVWCHRLIVPVLDRVVFKIVHDPLLGGGKSDAQRVCKALSDDPDKYSDGDDPEVYKFFIAITSDATIRMQSPVVVDDLL